MVTRREAALRLDIPMEMARRNGIPPRLTETELKEIDEHPPTWLAQSRANRTGKKAVWVTLTCTICGFTEHSRPKKWWPEFTYLSCAHHGADELPVLAAGHSRTEIDGIGTRFIGIVDEAPPGVAEVLSTGPTADAIVLEPDATATPQNLPPD